MQWADRAWGRQLGHVKNKQELEREGEGEGHGVVRCWKGRWSGGWQAMGLVLLAGRREDYGKLKAL